MNYREQTYCVARHYFSLQMNEMSPLWERLDNYASFMVNSVDRIKKIFTLAVRENDDNTDLSHLQYMGDFDSDGSCMQLFATADGGRMFCVYSHYALVEHASRLHISPDYHAASLYFHHATNIADRMFALTNALMLLFAFTTATLGTLLMHASVIVNGGKAAMFLGRSGTGKSTHSLLWLEHIPGSRLLNDDNPVIRIAEDDTPVIYGSPWSGKTPCYLNESAPLTAVVRLSQAPFNKITPIKGAMAYAAISPSLSAMRWEPQMADGIHNTLTRLTAATAVYQLQCLPDEAAAHLCAHAAGATSTDTVRKEESCSE